MPTDSNESTAELVPTDVDYCPLTHVENIIARLEGWEVAKERDIEDIERLTKRRNPNGALTHEEYDCINWLRLCILKSRKLLKELKQEISEDKNKGKRLLIQEDTKISEL